MDAGRRTRFLRGLSGLFKTLLSLCCLGLDPESQKQPAPITTVSLMLMWAAFHQFSVSTVAFSWWPRCPPVAYR